MPKVAISRVAELTCFYLKSFRSLILISCLHYREAVDHLLVCHVHVAACHFPVCMFMSIHVVSFLEIGRVHEDMSWKAMFLESLVHSG